MQRANNEKQASESPERAESAAAHIPSAGAGPAAAAVPSAAVAPASNPPVGAPTPAALPLAAALSPAVVLPTGSAWVQELLQTPPLHRFVDFGLRTTTLDAEAVRRLEQALAAMTARSSVQEALWYLEHSDWNVGQAVAQYHQDESQRARDHAAQYRVTNENANPVTSANYHVGDLTFQGTERVGRQSRQVEFRFPHAGGFNPNDPDQLRQLNQWLGDLVRWFRGPPAAAKAKNAPYTVFEERFVRNLFADRDYAADEGPGFPQIVREFNAIFQGRYLPGAPTPCGQRLPGSLTNLVDLRWRRDVSSSRRTSESNRRAAEAIRKTRLDEQREHDQLLADADADADAADGATVALLNFAEELFVRQDDGPEEVDDSPDFGESDQLLVPWSDGDSGGEDLSEGQPSRKRQRKE